MKSIYFYDGKQIKRSIAFGQMIDLFWACYLRGLELGYEKIIMEWHNFITIRWFNNGTCIHGMTCPKKDIYPLKFVEKGTKIEADAYVDISEPNSLFGGCPPLMANDKITAKPFSDYFSKYVQKYGEMPRLCISTQYDGEKYILIHYRYSEQDRQKNRNIPDGYYEDIISWVRRIHPQYKVYKIGEQSKLDNMVDVIFAYFLTDTDRLFELIYNCSHYIGPLSGPISLAWFMKKPTISLLSERDVLANEKMLDWYPDTIKLVNLENEYLEGINKHMVKYG